MNMLATYVLAWRTSADALLALAPELSEADWATPTDCPGWSVHDVYAHLAHLESELNQAGDPSPTIEDGQQMPSDHTEAGVEARRGRPSADVVAELAAGVLGWADRLEPLPDDPSAPAPTTSAGLAWSWDTLLRNRSIDMWVHEQDVRRAIGRPGGFENSPGAMVTLNSLAFALPFVLGKKVKASSGTSVRWRVTGEVPLDVTVAIGDDGRAKRTDDIETPTTTLEMSSETFGILTAGRRAPGDVTVSVTGDHDLAQQVLAAMAVTP